MDTFAPLESEVEAYCNFLVDSFNLFQKKYKFLEGLYITYHSLHEAVCSAFIDIARFSKSHAISLPDHHKMFAYLVKWLTIKRPIQYPKDFESAKDFSTLEQLRLSANEAFIVLILCGLLKFRPEELSDEFINYLLYSFKFRLVSGRMLAGMLYLIETKVQYKIQIREAIEKN